MSKKTRCLACGGLGYRVAGISLVEPCQACSPTEDAPVAAHPPGDVKAEAKRVVRHLQRYSPEERAHRAASHRLGHRQRTAVGEYFYTHPDLPGVAFPRRIDAARAATKGAKEDQS